MDKTTALAFGAGMLILSILFMPAGAKVIPYLAILGIFLGVLWFTRI